MKLQRYSHSELRYFGQRMPHLRSLKLNWCSSVKRSWRMREFPMQRLTSLHIEEGEVSKSDDLRGAGGAASGPTRLLFGSHRRGRCATFFFCQASSPSRIWLSCVSVVISPHGTLPPPRHSLSWRISRNCPSRCRSNGRAMNQCWERWANLREIVLLAGREFIERRRRRRRQEGKEAEEGGKKGNAAASSSSQN